LWFFVLNRGSHHERSSFFGERNAADERFAEGTRDPRGFWKRPTENGDRAYVLRIYVPLKENRNDRSVDRFSRKDSRYG